jgi:hypothetical protein
MSSNIYTVRVYVHQYLSWDTTVNDCSLYLFSLHFSYVKVEKNKQQQNNGGGIYQFE